MLSASVTVLSLCATTSVVHLSLQKLANQETTCIGDRAQPVRDAQRRAPVSAVELGRSGQQFRVGHRAQPVRHHQRRAPFGCRSFDGQDKTQRDVAGRVSAE